MMKLVFLVIFLVVLLQAQGHRRRRCPRWCRCPRGVVNDIFINHQFAMIATVTDLNFTPASIPTGYVSILVLISQSCKSGTPGGGPARLSTLDVPNNAFDGLILGQTYYFIGTYENLHSDFRRTFVVDRCYPGCNATICADIASPADCY